MNRNLVLLVLILALAVAFGGGGVAHAELGNTLFFSEYIEGSSNNKALEIYNGTGSPVDLAAAGYNVQMFFNGSASAGLTINLSGIVSPGDVFVLAHASAVTDILAQADQTNGSGWYNGDDAVVLRKGEAIVDAVGQVGFDPGSEWGAGLVSTQDNTLRRMGSVCGGDTVASDAFDPAGEWDGYAQNTFDGLGSHTASCIGINELRIDQSGTDIDEYFELAGPAGASLDGLTYLVIGDGTGGSGVIEEVTSLAGQTIPSSGYFVAAEGSFTLGTADLVTDLNFENSDNVTHLLVRDFSGADGDDLDTNDDGVLDVTPWSELVSLIALVEEANPPTNTEYHYGPPQIGPDGSFVPGHAYRCADGWNIGDFGGADDTPGAANPCVAPPPPPEACGDAYTPIYDIQGSGLASALDGSEVATEGVVVGDFQENDGDLFNTDLDGFFIQDATGDGDAATSDGIFVYAPGQMDVVEGDHVRVRGVVDEYFDLTEITSVANVWLCDSGLSVAPTAVTLPVAEVDEYEPYEGMLVTFPQALTISEYYNFDRYGEIVLTGGRQFQPTAVYEPGSWQAAALDAQNDLYRITLDDGRTSQNPDPARHPNGDVFDMDNLFRGGDVVTNLTGALNYSFGIYRVQPTTGADYTPANPRTAAPQEVGGNVRVASFNVLNYFLSIDDGVWDCGPSLDMECRGADTEDEFARQRAKILSALAAIDADVFGLIEMENTPDVEPLANIVSGLNDVMGAGTYAYVDTGVIGTDAIRVGIIYKPGTVSLIGDAGVLDSQAFVNPLGGEYDRNRPAVAASFMDNTDGGVFTVVVNHLKSKGSACPEEFGVDPNPDPESQVGSCNYVRTLAAGVLLDWLATDPTGSGSENVLVIGDLNSYDKEDPIDVFLMGPDDVAGTGDDYVDLLFHYIGEFAYSYLFDGQLGYLDYALANEALLPYVTGTTVWHINADEPDLIDYDMSFKLPPQDALYEPDAYRSSDHDPVIVGLAVCEEEAPSLEVTVSPDILWPANHKYVTVTADVSVSDNFDLYPEVTLVSVTSNEPDNGEDDGDTTDDIVIIDDFTFDLRAERSGTGTGRIYTITYQATDDCGNTTIATATVTVPLSMGEE